MEQTLKLLTMIIFRSLLRPHDLLSTLKERGESE
ncbi:hypothetical protein PGF_00002850 [Porphyromonas gingivalis 381]|nr:hypothetical protein PGF_00002850 [Porphyromonas gingivalis 381]